MKFQPTWRRRCGSSFPWGSVWPLCSSPASLGSHRQGVNHKTSCYNTINVLAELLSLLWWWTETFAPSINFEPTSIPTYPLKKYLTQQKLFRTFITLPLYTQFQIFQVQLNDHQLEVLLVALVKSNSLQFKSYSHTERGVKGQLKSNSQYSNHYRGYSLWFCLLRCFQTRRSWDEWTCRTDWSCCCILS